MNIVNRSALNSWLDSLLSRIWRRKQLQNKKQTRSKAINKTERWHQSNRNEEQAERKTKEKRTSNNISTYDRERAVSYTHLTLPTKDGV